MADIYSAIPVPPCSASLIDISEHCANLLGRIAPSQYRGLIMQSPLVLNELPHEAERHVRIRRSKRDRVGVRHEMGGTLRGRPRARSLFMPCGTPRGIRPACQARSDQIFVQMAKARFGHSHTRCGSVIVGPHSARISIWVSGSAGRHRRGVYITR